MVDTLALHMEYPTKTRFDLAVLAETTEAAEAGSPRLTNDAFWSQPVQLAVEMKYCQLGDPLTTRYDQLLSDVEKMERYASRLPQGSRFHGLGLLFVQSRDERMLDVIQDELTAVSDVEVDMEAFEVQAFVVAPSKTYVCSKPDRRRRMRELL